MLAYKQQVIASTSGYSKHYNSCLWNIIYATGDNQMKPLHIEYTKCTAYVKN